MKLRVHRLEIAAVTAVAFPIEGNSTARAGSHSLDLADLENPMDKKLHLLDSFEAQGTDGACYKVMAYEHLLRMDLATDGRDHWEPTGLSEYRLASGERVGIASDGEMRVIATGVKLHPARFR